MVRARARQRGVELPLIISDHADWDELTGTLAELAPGEVWITHGREEALARWCELNGLAARALAIVGYEDEEDSYRPRYTRGSYGSGCSTPASEAGEVMPRLRLILAVLVTPLALPASAVSRCVGSKGVASLSEKHMVAEALLRSWPALRFSSLAAILLSVGLLMAYKRMLALFVILATATCADFVGILTAIWFRSWSVFTNIVELAEVLVVGEAFGAILGAIFCCMAGTPLSRTPLRPSRLLAVVSKLMAFGRAVAVLASIAFVPFVILVGDNGSIPLPRPGFSIAFQGTVQPTRTVAGW